MHVNDSVVVVHTKRLKENLATFRRLDSPPPSLYVKTRDGESKLCVPQKEPKFDILKFFYLQIEVDFPNLYGFFFF